MEDEEEGQGVSILTSPNAVFKGQWEQIMKQVMQMNITWLKIPTGRRQISWLFTNVAENLN